MSVGFFAGGDKVAGEGGPMPTRLGQVLCRMAFVVTLMGMGLASCVSVPQLPAATKPVVVCLYEALKSTPGVVAVVVYVQKGYGPVISYTFHNDKGKLTTTDLGISGPDGQERFHYTGDFMSRDNPLSGMYVELGSRCQADGFYNDQVIITGPDNDPYRWRVDMSHYAN